MKREVHYKQGYRIIICGRFYEVVDGKCVVFYGKLNNKPTLQQVWNQTVALRQAEIIRRKRNMMGLAMSKK